MAATKTLEIRMGALSDSITEQLGSQGFACNPETVGRFDESKRCIAFLAIQGVISHAERAKAEQRLFKDIRKHVEGCRL